MKNIFIHPLKEIIENSNFEYNYYIYVLISKDNLHHYVGLTKDVGRRLQEHNSGKSKSTKPYLPWSIVYIESFGSRLEARKREKYLKSCAGRKFLKKTELNL